ncbi:MAG: DUF4168 domain-containing protein [Pseudooceanicola atlanticus]
MTDTKSKLLRGVMVAGLALSPVAAFAQAADSTAPEAGASEELQSELSFTDAELSGFADATVKMQQVRQTYMPQIEAAADDAERQELAQQANSEMVSAVESAEGIDVETYNAIGRAAQEDETLRAQLVAMVQQRVGMDPGTQNDEG